MNESQPPGAGDESERLLSAVSRLLAGATLVNVIVSWPLWVGSDLFPRVSPLPSGWDLEGPRWLVWTRMLLAAAGLAWMALGRHGPRLRWLRWCAAGVAGLFAWSVLADIERLQPWAQHMMLGCLAIAGLPAGLAVWGLRWLVVSLYLFSGVSKLDRSFLNEMGPVFLQAALAPLGFDPSAWAPALQGLLILSMPLFEAVVGVLLAVAATRRLGVVGSTSMHLSLIWILGPWNLGHSPNVLLWNLSLMMEVWVLFGRAIPAPQWPPIWAWPASVAVAAALVMPVLEPFGLLDPWPAHALYSSHVGRVRVLVLEVPQDGFNQAPGWLRDSVSVRPDGVATLDLTLWSRSVRAVPIYPGIWPNMALARWLAPRLARYGRVRVEVDSPAARFSGRRQYLAFDGLDEIARTGQDVAP